jgi:hypothetical protein
MFLFEVFFFLKVSGLSFHRTPQWVTASESVFFSVTVCKKIKRRNIQKMPDSCTKYVHCAISANYKKRCGKFGFLSLTY